MSKRPAWEWIRERQKTDERLNGLFDTIGKLMYLEELLNEYAERHYRAALETDKCPTCSRVMKWQAIVCTDLNHSSPAPAVTSEEGTK